MTRVIPASIVLSIGDLPMTAVPVSLEIERRGGRRHLLAIVLEAMDGRAVRIGAEGLCESGGRWQQSPLSKAYWTAAQAFLEMKVKAPPAQVLA